MTFSDQPSLDKKNKSTNKTVNLNESKIKTLKETDELSEIEKFLDDNVLKKNSILDLVFDFLKKLAQKSNFIW